MATAPADPNQRKILRLYAAFGAALVLSVVPFILAALLSMILIFGVLIAAYILRTDTTPGSLVENHMTFIIRTIWIGSFLALLTMTAGSIYLFQTIDNTPLDPCLQPLLDIRSGQTLIDPYAVFNILRGCFDNYWVANIKTFIISGSIAAGPVLLYFIVRYARGLARAMDGYRVANPHFWF